MALKLRIGNTDRTSDIVLGSLKIENHLTRRADTCKFSIQAANSDYSVRPAMGREVIVEDDGSYYGKARMGVSKYGAGGKLFGGHIIRIDEVVLGFGLLRYDVECMDYTRQLGRKLVVESYTGYTANAIIADLMATYGPSDVDYTSWVDCPLDVAYVAFNYKPLDKCIEELADMVGYDWYIDPYKRLRFFAQEANVAPFELEDDTGTFEYDTLVVRRDSSQVRNTVYVRGGQYLAANVTAEIETQADQSIYPIPYVYEDFKATLTGQVLDIGSDDNNSNLANYDGLHGKSEKIIRLRRTPTAGSDLRVSGRPYRPVIIQVQNQPAIDAMVSAEGGGDGIYEHLIIDKSINDRDGARERGVAELRQYQETLSEGEFETTKAGLKAGQQIRINSASRGTDEYFIINRVTSTQETATTLRYRVSIVTKKTFDAIAILQKLLMQETKNLEIKSGEILDVARSADETINVSDEAEATLGPQNAQSETITLGESTTVQALNYAVEFVVGPLAAPSGTKRLFVLDHSPLG